MCKTANKNVISIFLNIPPAVKSVQMHPVSFYHVLLCHLSSQTLIFCKLIQILKGIRQWMFSLQDTCVLGLRMEGSTGGGVSHWPPLLKQLLRFETKTSWMQKWGEATFGQMMTNHASLQINVSPVFTAYLTLTNRTVRDICHGTCRRCHGNVSQPGEIKVGVQEEVLKDQVWPLCVYREGQNDW